ncbi:branched-chain amino acid ABC transporter permease [Virgibacillus dakarensis]|uniref:Autotransporter n=1 Tax=Lentibacillus populi TaxID=1827502 RepID=A0A9W5TZJ2_9BACI|nr:MULTISPECIES: AzlC family ABC transporter permease [Bacillaceae]MBT2218241.1 AzlC family ABC transporter permease [Virgibacillus dakarensis]MTW85535.1 branched-chain amino acid ABC transporter permease [Virgibacillus dakarensis]GGB51367.1 autotransporter [Lentibacillus populi]
MVTNTIEKKDTSQAIHMIKKGIAVGFPIMLGYLPIAITYGVLAKSAGMSLVELTMMSVLVFAGASQFMGANMIAVGAGAVEIIVATFVLNFRHFVMSLSFMNRLRGIGLNWKVPLSLGLTDETFAVSSLHPKEAKVEKGALFYTALIVTAYFSWVFGSFLGGVLGEIIPEKLSQSMGIALYAMFIGLLVPSVKKEIKVGLIAIIAMLINTICTQFMSDGWAIVFGTVLGGLSGIYLLKGDQS